MKREDLDKFELSKEAIDQIMALNGKDIEAGKGRLTAAEQERDALKTQLAEANKQIESFKAMDVEAIKKSADEYKAKFEQAEADAKAKMDQLKFDHALDGALKEAKAKSAKAVKALINVEGLKLTDDGVIVGLKEQLEKIKSENDYLFESETKPPKVTTGGGTGKPPLAGNGFLSALMKGAELTEKELGNG